MSGETPSQRRDRRRAEQAGLTDEQLAHREDEQFERSRGVLRLFASLPGKMRVGIVPLRRRIPTTGRPAGSGAEITMDELESAVDRPDDPPFGWTLQLFRHFGSGKRVFKAVAGTQSGAIACNETNRWLEELARSELRRLGVAGRRDQAQVEMVVRFMVGTFVGFMTWWMRDENEHLSAEDVDEAFRSLVLPGVANVLGLELATRAGTRETAS